MTIPKSAGLSHLADVSNEQALAFHYPIKRKGERRRLNPNWDAICWLEDDSAEDCEIEYIEPMGSGELKELNVLYTFGRESKSYPRPMIQIIPRDAFSGANQSVSPCSCDRFDYSWEHVRCEKHTEVEWDWEGRCWKRPRTGAPGCPCHECRTPPLAYASPSPTLDGLYARILEEDRLLTLPDTPITLATSFAGSWEGTSTDELPPTPFTLIVEGQTLQGVDHFEIEVTSEAGGPLEVRPNDSTS